MWQRISLHEKASHKFVTGKVLQVQNAPIIPVLSVLYQTIKCVLDVGDGIRKLKIETVSELEKIHQAIVIANSKDVYRPLWVL